MDLQILAVGFLMGCAFAFVLMMLLDRGKKGKDDFVAVRQYDSIIQMQKDIKTQFENDYEVTHFGVHLEPDQGVVYTVIYQTV